MLLFLVVLSQSKFARVTVAALAALSLTACSSSDDDSGATVFLKGDPIDLVSGATLNRGNNIKTSNLKDFNGFKAKSKMTFTGSINGGTGPVLLLSNVAQSTSIKNSLFDGLFDDGYQFESTGYGDYRFHDADAPGDVSFNFSLDENSENIILKSVTYEGRVHKAELLHVSMSHDKQHMTFLIYIKQNDQRELITVYFERAEKDKIKSFSKSLSTKYYFIAGRGKGIYWSSPSGTLNLDTCGAEEFQEEISSAIEAWNGILPESFQLANSPRYSFAPFSDLNEKCIYMSNLYRAGDSFQEVVLGITAPILTKEKNAFIDGDIVIFHNEINREYGTEYSYSRSVARNKAVRHEIGHFLGLGHPFDSTPSDFDERSIMDYRFNDYDFTEYDRNAVRLLYKQ